MSIEGISYADIYSGNLTDEEMQYFDDLGVEWRGRNVLEIRDEVCIKIMAIFSKVYEQTALSDPAALPQLKAEIIQYFEGLFVPNPVDEDEPSPLAYRFDPISGTYRELIMAEGFFKKLVKAFTPIPTKKTFKKATDIYQEVTKPITKVEAKAAEWVEEHPIAAAVIGVAVVVTLIATLGPASGPVTEAVVETIAAAGAASAGAAAATPSNSGHKKRDENEPTPPQGLSSPQSASSRPAPVFTAPNITPPISPNTFAQKTPAFFNQESVPQSASKHVKPEVPASTPEKTLHFLNDVRDTATNELSKAAHGAWKILGLISASQAKGQDLVADKIFSTPSENEQQLCDKTKEGHAKIDEFFGTQQASRHDPNYKPHIQVVSGEMPFPMGSTSLLGRASQVGSLEANATRTSTLASEVIKDISALERAGLVIQEVNVAKNIGSEVEFFEKNLTHIFRESAGHLKDTPANRQLLIDTASSLKNYLGKDRHGNEWYAQLLTDGSQIWVEVRESQIRNGGLNSVPNIFEGLQK